MCWLGKYRTVLDENADEAERITEADVNMACRCPNEFYAFFCDDGHLTECHVGMSCETARCSHHQRLAISDELLGEDEL